MHTKGKVKVMAEFNILVVARVWILLETVLPVRQIRPDEPSNIETFSAVEVTHASPQSVCVKDDAPANMKFIWVTLDTSHLERSLLNDNAEANITFILVTLDTSHLEISLLNDEAEANMDFIRVTLDSVCVSVRVSRCACVRV